MGTGTLIRGFEAKGLTKGEKKALVRAGPLTKFVTYSFHKEKRPKEFGGGGGNLRCHGGGGGGGTALTQNCQMVCTPTRNFRSGGEKPLLERRGPLIHV